jgi:putative FmdB family regulatory protein
MTYEYACGACGNEWEAEQRISEEPLKKCPKCGKLQAKRQISRGAGFILKGGGWYADGYGSSKGGSGGGEPKASSSSESKPSASTESKPSETKSTETKASDSGSSGSSDSPKPTDSKGKTAAA